MPTPLRCVGILHVCVSCHSYATLQNTWLALAALWIVLVPLDCRWVYWRPCHRWVGQGHSRTRLERGHSHGPMGRGHRYCSGVGAVYRISDPWDRPAAT